MKKLTTSEFKERLYNLYGDQFEVLSEYVNNVTKITLKCNHCGNVIQKAPVKMTGATREGCYICSKKNGHKTTDYFQKELNEKYPDTYIVLGEYVRARDPLLVQRKDCGHTYYASPDNLLRGKGCPKCSIKQSSYMDIVEEYLDNNNIEYVKEKRFDDCKNIRTLPFDYYLPRYNVCIEVDGEFHYSNSSVFKNSERGNYENVHKRDNIKTQYCKDNNIKLIRLPYYKKDIFSEILNTELHANTETTNRIA